MELKPTQYSWKLQLYKNLEKSPTIKLVLVYILYCDIGLHLQIWDYDVNECDEIR